MTGTTAILVLLFTRAVSATHLLSLNADYGKSGDVVLVPSAKNLCRVGVWGANIVGGKAARAACKGKHSCRLVVDVTECPSKRNGEALIFILEASRKRYKAHCVMNATDGCFEEIHPSEMSTEYELPPHAGTSKKGRRKLRSELPALESTSGRQLLSTNLCNDYPSIDENIDYATNPNRDISPRRGCGSCYLSSPCQFCCNQCVFGGHQPFCVSLNNNATCKVQLHDGSVKTMDRVRIGDKVLSADPATGALFYDEVYMFGHKAAAAAAAFVELGVPSGAALRLTPDHHLPVVRAGESLLIPSSQVQVGDLVRVAPGTGHSAASLEPVVAKTVAQDRGLFNPYTLSGSIVVDGVAASVHSSSALDGAFRLLGVSIPSGYQAMFGPVRAVYRVLGPQCMASVEFIIDGVAAAMNGEVSTVPAVGATCAPGVAVVLAARKRAA